MKLAIKTCTLDMPYEEMLDFCVQQKIAAIEIGTGNWSGAPHCDLDLLVSDKTAREKWFDAMRAKGLELCALNCSGNPLAYEKDMDVTKKTFELAQMLGVKKIVMMSGLPAGCKGDKTPVWITTSWPPETQDILDYQWNEVAIPEWKNIVKMAEDCGIEKIALENHGMQLVYNPETLLRLREAVGPMVGMNLDPSHLFWMGGDPIEAAACSASTARFIISTARIRARSAAAGSRTVCSIPSRSTPSHAARGTMSPSAQATTQSGGRSSSRSSVCPATTTRFRSKWRT